MADLLQKVGRGARLYYAGLARINSDLKLLILLLLVVFISKAFILDKPVWWSELTYYEGVKAVFNNGLDPFIEYRSYKPPLLYLISGLLYTLFGPQVMLLRLEVIAFSAAALLYTIKLGRLLFGTTTAYVAATLLYSSALYYTMSEQFVAGVPVTALTLACFYHYLRRQRVAWLISAALFVMTKETALVVLGAMGLHAVGVAVYRTFTEGFSLRHLADPLMCLWPLVVFGAWMLANMHFLGWYLWPTNAGFMSEMSFPWWGVYWLVKRIFLDEFRLILVGGLVALVIRRGRAHGLPGAASWLFVLVLVFTVLFYWMNCGPVGSKKDYFPLSRYYLYLYPVLYLYGTHAILRFFDRRRLAALVLVPFGLLSLTTWSPGLVKVNTENDLNHRHMAYVQRDAARYVQRVAGSRMVYVGDGWLVDVLTTPDLGYVPAKVETRIIPVEMIPDALASYPRLLMVTARWHCPMKGHFGYELLRSDEFNRAIHGLRNKGQLRLVRTFRRGCDTVSVFEQKRR